jgi:hypothetical protein
MTSKKDRTAKSGINVVTFISEVSRGHMIGVRNTSELPVIRKKDKTTS